MDDIKHIEITNEFRYRIDSMEKDIEVYSKAISNLLSEIEYRDFLIKEYKTRLNLI